MSECNPKRSGGRPPITTGKKVCFVRARLTETEYAALLTIEKELGLNHTALIRKKLLGDSDQQLVNARAVLLRLDALGAELGRAGNNINQLARHANTLKLQGNLSEQVMTEFILVFRQYARIRGDTEQALRSIIRLIRS